jgi:hypothetical protein
MFNYLIELLLLVFAYDDTKIYYLSFLEFFFCFFSSDIFFSFKITYYSYILF